MKIKDSLWLWGQDASSHHCVGRNGENIWKIPGINRMEPLEGAKFLGIENCCRVAMNGKPEPPFSEEAEKLKSFRKLVWSVLGDSGSARNGDMYDDLAALVEIAAKYQNITGGVLDDFFRPEGRPEDTDRIARLPLSRVRKIRDSLHSLENPLELWMVIYENGLYGSCRKYLELCDVITLWTWYGENLEHLEKNFSRLVKLSPGKKHFAGCYLYDYGNCRPMPLDLMKRQCDFYYENLKNGKLQGVIICSNCVADLGLEATEYAREWVAGTGNEDIPE
jgi:hypothetical protein